MRGGLETDTEYGGFTEIAVAIRLTAAPAVVPQKWPLGKLYNPVVCHRQIRYQVLSRSKYKSNALPKRLLKSDL